MPFSAAEVEELVAAVREACPAAIWSQGIELTRRDVVSGESEDADEIVLRVAASAHGPAPTVVLYPGDGEWDCDCPSRADVCVHVVAAALATSRARAESGGLPSSASAGGQVHYRFVRESGGLALTREIANGDGDVRPLEGTLQSLVGRGGGGVAATQIDLQVDRLLGTRVRGRVPDDRLEHLFTLLSGTPHLFLEQQPVHLSDEVVRPLARLEDGPSGAVRLRVDRDPAIDDVVASRVVRIGDTLHLLGETEISGRQLERLPFEQLFPPAALGELVTRLLPELRVRTALTIATGRVPGVDPSTPPRIAVNLEERGGRLSVLATLVYGNPPQARIDGDRLVHLGGDVPVRDIAAERRLVLDLRDRLGLIPGRRAELAGEEAARFADRLRAFRGQVRGQELLAAPALSVQLDTTGDRLVLVFEAGDRQANAAEVMAAWRHGLDVVSLDGGGFGRVPKEWLDLHGDKVAALLAARKSDGTLPAHAGPALARLCDELGAPRPPLAERLAPIARDFDGLPRAPMPDDLTAELRPYQRAGIDWLIFLREAGLGGVLADDMGLGKTLQSMCAIAGRSLVVCPRSVVWSWADEIARFRPALRVSVYHGSGRALDADADVTLTTYGVLRQDVEALSAVDWDGVLLDEAQAIKNPASQAAAAARRLPARWRLALTGTPVENRLDELWSLMEFAVPGAVGERADFRERYADPIGGGDDGAAARLHELLRPFILRRMKRDVLPDLPPRTEALLPVELGPEERAVYDTVRAAAQTEVARILDGGAGVMAALEALLRLRQAACHPSLVPGQQAETSSKIERLVAALDEAAADGHKALVFSQWTSALDLIEPHLDAAGIGFTRLDGSTRDRAAVVADFQSPAGPPVILISLKAGGTGLNLTAADHVFLFDPWWNPTAEDQAADRAHRIGQDKPVLVYRLVALDTVEQRILALQEKKRALANAALAGTGGAAALNRDDLLALLQ